METYYVCSGASIVMSGGDLKQVLEQSKCLVRGTDMELCVWNNARRVVAVIHSDGSVLLFGEFVSLGDW